MYPGGKSQAKHVFEILNDPIFDGKAYLEPFVGLAHVLYKVVRKQSYSASDVSENVITLLRTLKQRGMFPTIDKEAFDCMKKVKNEAEVFQRFADFDADELRAFASVATFNGINWCFAGFAGGRYAQTRARYYRKLIENATINQCDYSVCDYKAHQPRNSVVYCDPPYQCSASLNRNFYNMANTFDYDLFWQTMREWSKPEYNNAVFISEASAPDDFIMLRCKKRSLKRTGVKVNSNAYHDALFV